MFLDKSLNVKLGDFGLSRTISDPESAFAQTYVGTPYYMSPVYFIVTVRNLSKILDTMPKQIFGPLDA